PAHVDSLPALVEEVECLHAYPDGQRRTVVERRVRRQPDGQLSRAAVVPTTVTEHPRVVALVVVGPALGDHGVTVGVRLRAAAPTGEAGDQAAKAVLHAGARWRGAGHLVDDHGCGADVEERE